MMVERDPDAGALYVRLADESTSVRTIELDSGVLVDIDENGKPVGVEVLQVAQPLRGVARDPVPSPKAVTTADELTNRLVAAGVDKPARVAAPNGSVQLEWHQDGVDIEVYVETDGGASVWANCPDLEWIVGQVLRRAEASAQRPIG